MDSYGLSAARPCRAPRVRHPPPSGDLAEDGTLVYLWLRPYPRWQLAVPPSAASMTVVVPVAVVPFVIGAAFSGGGAARLAAAAAVPAGDARLLGGLLRVSGCASAGPWLGARLPADLGAGRRPGLARRGPGVAVHQHPFPGRIFADHVPPKTRWHGRTGILVPVAVAAVALFLTARSLDQGEIA